MGYRFGRARTGTGVACGPQTFIPARRKPAVIIIGKLSKVTVWIQAGSRSRAARIGQRAVATVRALPSTRLGFQVGDRLSRPLCDGVLGLRRVSVRVCAMDGEQALALCRSNGGSIVCTERGQYSGFRWCRGERKDILGLAVVRLLHAPAVVDQSFVGCLCFALGYCDGTSLHLVSLDASRGPRLGR